MTADKLPIDPQGPTPEVDTVDSQAAQFTLSKSTTDNRTWRPVEASPSTPATLQHPGWERPDVDWA
jgi:hypothetical protein